MYYFLVWYFFDIILNVFGMEKIVTSVAVVRSRALNVCNHLWTLGKYTSL